MFSVWSVQSVCRWQRPVSADGSAIVFRSLSVSVRTAFVASRRGVRSVHSEMRSVHAELYFEHSDSSAVLHSFPTDAVRTVPAGTAADDGVLPKTLFDLSRERRVPMFPGLLQAARDRQLSGLLPATVQSTAAVLQVNYLRHPYVFSV